MMNSCADGGSSRVSIPDHLRKTLHSIREITGKQHSDEDIFAVYKDSFNDPHETAQQLLFLDTFHEVRSKREKRKENVVPVTQGSERSGRRNIASANGRRASFKKDCGANHVTGGSRSALPVTNKAKNINIPHGIKVSGPTSLPSGVSKHKVEVDFAATVNNSLAEKNHLSKSTSSSNNSTELEAAKAISEPVDAPVSVSLVQNIQDVTSSQVSQPVVKNQPAELQSSIFGREDPSLIFASDSSSQSDQVTEIETASNKTRTQSLLKPDVSEKSHVTFPSHLQVAEVLHNGLTFGSFDYNYVKEASSNSGASGGDDSNFESSHRTGDDEGESSPTTSAIPGVASAREETPVFSEDKDYNISNSAPGAELLGNSEEALSNSETDQIAYGQEAPLNMFGLVPSLSALGQPVNTDAAETQLGNSIAPAIPLVSYSPEQCSIAAASQQATHLFRQQYPPNFFPYGPYYPPFYMPPPYIHQFLSHPQQPYFPPGAALAPPAFVKPVGNTENPPTSNPSTHASSTVSSHIPSATVLNTVRSEEKMTSPLTESAAAWIGQGLGNLHLSPMYNLALQGQPLGFPVVNGGLMGIHQPMQPIPTASTTYQTLLPPTHTTAAMAEPIGHPHIAYQQAQATLTNRVNDY